MSETLLRLAEISKYYSTVYLRSFYRMGEGKEETLNIRVEHENRELPSKICMIAKHDGGIHEFTVQFLFDGTEFPGNAVIIVEHEDGDRSFVLDELRNALLSSQRDLVTERFYHIIGELSPDRRYRLLDIGGRARSGNQISERFSDFDCTVLDIIYQDGVDVVCDAHKMSSRLERESFDVIICISVLEHILMPWKLAIEMNKVLKMGGIAMIHTHQTIGLHDMPWDFWRFSDQAWHGLFNKATGFEIVQAAMTGFGRIIPYMYTDRHFSAESSGGFESSSVIVRKIGPTSLSWDADLDSILETHYPTSPDGNLRTWTPR